MQLISKTVDCIFHEKLKHICRFSLVGAANTLLDFIIFTASHGLIGLNSAVSQVLGYSFGTANSFICNKKWTFDDANSKKKAYHELIEFLTVNAVSMIISVLAIDFMVNNLSMNAYISKIIVILLTQVTNFLGYKLWVFKKN